MRKPFAPTDQILFTSMRYFGKRSLDLPMKILPLDFRYFDKAKEVLEKKFICCSDYFILDLLRVFLIFGIMSEMEAG